MTTQHTHVIVRNDPPPQPQVMTVGRLYAIGPEPVFKTQVPSYAPNFVADEEEEKAFEEAETKVIRKKGRRPAPPTEGVETK